LLLTRPKSNLLDPRPDCSTTPGQAAGLALTMF
jgi:hypothetical protein